MTKSNSYTCNITLSYGENYKDSYWLSVNTIGKDINTLRKISLDILPIVAYSLGIEEGAKVCVSRYFSWDDNNLFSIKKQYGILKNNCISFDLEHCSCSVIASYGKDVKNAFLLKLNYPAKDYELLKDDSSKELIKILRENLCLGVGELIHVSVNMAINGKWLDTDEQFGVFQGDHIEWDL